MELVISENKFERKPGAIDPSSPLYYECLEIIYGIGVSNRIFHVFQYVSSIHLTVDSEAQNSVLSQKHVRFLKVLFLGVLIQNNLQVPFLKQIFLHVYERSQF